MPETETQSVPSDSRTFAERYESGWGLRRVGWTSLVFAALQSVCTAFAGLAGLRLALGAGSLAFAGPMAVLIDRFHADWVRVPMVVLALAGSLVNIAVLLQVRRLRQNPASNWRRRTRSAREKRLEAWQWSLSILTLVSIAVEEYFHNVSFRHF